MRKILLIVVILGMTGCGGITATQEGVPPEGYKEVRCAHIDGQGRYGSFTQYVKGAAKFFKLTIFGDLPANTTISCGVDGVGITTNELIDP